MMSDRTSKHLQSGHLELLASIFHFMLKSGARPAEVSSLCAQALEYVRINPDQLNLQRSGGLASAALILDAWHRSRIYIDKDAQPIAVPLLGKSPSVEALIRSEKSQRDPVAFARQLKSLGLLTRCGKGKYKPVSQIALIGGTDPVVRQYVATSSATLLTTMKHNIACSSPSSKLIERFAEVPDLPQRYAAEFRKFSRSQGWAFLRTLNDWLESRRARGRKGERTIRAGTHLYAYADTSAQAKTRTRKRTYA